MAGAGYARAFSTAPLRMCNGVEFTLWDPDEIKKGSVVECTEPTSHIEGVAQPNSCHDLRLGVTEYSEVCLTCNMDKNECPGHWGNIPLAKAMFHYGYLRTVVQVLRCVCVHCSIIKLDPRDAKFKEAAAKKKPEQRLRLFAKYCAGRKTCDAGHATRDNPDDLDEAVAHQGCNKPQPTVFHQPQSFNLWTEYKQENVDASDAERKQRLYPEDARRILAKIPDDQLELLGFSVRNRPEWMILTQLPVAPPAIRPAIAMDAVTKTEDHTTQMYNKVITMNQNLKERVTRHAAASVIDDIMQDLQHTIVTMMDNERNGIPRAKVRSGQPIKSIRERLKGKGGRVRSNLMGKRVDFSARTVIGGDSQIGMDEVAMPLSVASNMTFPERVTDFNIEKLRVAVENGPDKYPGAKFIIRNDGTRVNLAFTKRREQRALQPGYIVERHILTNDVVLFNRQPTLHRMSMMGHRARVMPFCTFRMNLSSTAPYNADFDGDEMNLHVPQSLLSKAELQEFMMVPKNIISPKSNSPVMGIVQDSLLGIYAVTRRSTFFDKQFMMNAVMHIPTMPVELPVPAILKPEMLWTGKQLFSLVLPPVNFTGKSNEDPDQDEPNLPVADTKVLIEKGQLLHGIIDKKSVGSSENSLVHIVYNEFSPDQARDLINGIQRITAYYLINRGFSVGVQDTVADKDTKSRIQDIIRESFDRVDSLCHEAQRGLERQPGKTVKETFEGRINQILNKTREDAGKRAQRSLIRANGFKQMVAAGSKGSYLNISQITAVVGQQNVGGKRIPYGFRKRTLPHFPQDDYGPESRGFVQNSYLEGLTPSEFFFHMSGGREGLIDTACKTAETGYIQRKLIKALEDIYVAYDATVRDAQGRVVQFLYGEEGYDSTKMESLKPLPLVEDSDADRDRRYKHDYEEKGEDWGLDFLDPVVRDQMLNDQEATVKMEEEYEEVVRNREWLRSVFMPAGQTPFLQPKDGIKVPINLKRLLENAKINFDINPKGLTDLSPVEVIDGVRKLREEMVVCRGEEPLHQERQRNGTRLWNVVLGSFLASKRVICEHRLNRRAFTWVLGEIRQRYNSAMIPPGEMVGCIAAQSMGEPATQMTLNTFHFAGVASKNVTLGVPRLKELINVIKKPKQQGLVIYLDETRRNQQEEAKKVQTVVEYLSLRDVTNKVEIWYDPEITQTVIPEDEEIVELDWDFASYPVEMQEEMQAKMKKMSPYIMRLEINSRAVINFDLSMKEIKDCIERTFPETYNLEASTDNMDKLVLRLRFMSDREEEKRMGAAINDHEVWEADGENTVEWLKKQENELLDRVHLRGIEGIKKVYMRKTEKEDRRVEYNMHGKPELRDEWVLDTDGTNMIRVMALEEVDPHRTSSNNITEILTTLGIEATRKKLTKELARVYGAYGIYINARHSSVLCDAMCNRGFLMPINRHGINRQDVGPLMKASYEETVEILMHAAAMGETDRMTGVSANVMLGNPTRIGTGLHSLLIDESKLKLTNISAATAMRSKRELLGQSGEGETASEIGRSPTAPTAFEGPSAVTGLASMSGRSMAGSDMGGANSWLGQFSNAGTWRPSASATPLASPLLSGGLGGASPAMSYHSPGFEQSAPQSQYESPAGPSPAFQSPLLAGGASGSQGPSGALFSGGGGLFGSITGQSPALSAVPGGGQGGLASPSMQSQLGHSASLPSPSGASSVVGSYSPGGVGGSGISYSPAIGSGGSGNAAYSPSLGSAARSYRPGTPGMSFDLTQESAASPSPHNAAAAAAVMGTGGGAAAAPPAEEEDGGFQVDPVHDDEHDPDGEEPDYGDDFNN